MFCFVFSFLKEESREFSGDSVGKGSGVVTALAWVSALAWIGSLAWELPHAMDVAKKKEGRKEKGKKERKKIKMGVWKQETQYLSMLALKLSFYC